MSTVSWLTRMNNSGPRRMAVTNSTPIKKMILVSEKCRMQGSLRPTSCLSVRYRQQRIFYSTHHAFCDVPNRTTICFVPNEDTEPNSFSKESDESTRIRYILIQISNYPQVHSSLRNCADRSGDWKESTNSLQSDENRLQKTIWIELKRSRRSNISGIMPGHLSL